MMRGGEKWIALRASFTHHPTDTHQLAAPGMAAAENQIGATFNSEGPGPAIGLRNLVGSGDNPPNGD